MAWSFRKRIKIAPGLKLNIGKRGINSLSIGGKGVSLNVGKRGVKARVSAGGLSSETMLADRAKRSRDLPEQNSDGPASADTSSAMVERPRAKSGCLYALALIGAVWAAIATLGALGPNPTTTRCSDTDYLKAADLFLRAQSDAGRAVADNLAATRKPDRVSAPLKAQIRAASKETGEAWNRTFGPARGGVPGPCMDIHRQVANARALRQDAYDRWLDPSRDPGGERFARAFADFQRSVHLTIEIRGKIAQLNSGTTNQ